MLLEGTHGSCIMLLGRRAKSTNNGQCRQDGSWMNGQHLGSLPVPPDVLINIFEDQWKNTGILQESESGFAEEAAELLKDGNDLITDADAALSNLLSYPLHATLSSDEAKSVVKDKLSEVASGLISAYDSGKLCQALAEGHDG